MSLHKDIDKAITDNLPQQVGEKLRAELEALEKSRNTVFKQEERIDSLEQNLTVMTLREDQAKNDLKKYSNLEAREKAVVIIENNWKVTEAELKLSEAEKRAEQALNLVRLVFKSPVFRKNIDIMASTQQAFTEQGQSYLAPDGGKHGEITETED